MRVFLTALLAVSSALAYDAVIFSNGQDITNESPSFDYLLSSATSDAPVVFLVNPDFTLGQFSKHALAYSTGKPLKGITASAKSSKSHSARHIPYEVIAEDAETITDANDFSTGSKVLIFAGEDWNTLELLYEQILTKLPEQTTFVVTATEAVSAQLDREKRAATDSTGATGAPVTSKSRKAQKSKAKARYYKNDYYGGKEMNMPMVIPPYNVTALVPNAAIGTCMMYMEGLNIIVDTSKVPGGKGGFATIPIRSNGSSPDVTWMYADGDVTCVNGTVGNYVFNVNLKVNRDFGGKASGSQDVVKILSGTVISFQITIMGDNLGYWRLVSAIVQDFKVTSVDQSFLARDVTTTKGSNSSQVNNVGMSSVQGWAFGCSDSQAMFFPTTNADDKVNVGISFFNTELQPFGVWDSKKNIAYFTLNVDDCVGTFSPGSWMAIISILVLLTGFIFGFLMLNSVQTMDRFDDPKQKQILINVRE